jgi:predicted nucleotidyltransferase
MATANSWIDERDPINAPEQRLAVYWHHLGVAREASRAKRNEIEKLATGLDSRDTSIVVSGSLARDELTPGSDIDWTLLSDGSADLKHHDALRKVGSLIEPFAPKPPDPEGSFGNRVFSLGGFR